MLGNVTNYICVWCVVGLLPSTNCLKLHNSLQRTINAGIHILVTYLPKNIKLFQLRINKKVKRYSKFDVFYFI